LEIEMNFAEDHRDFCFYLDEQLALARSRLRKRERH
jgi:hypothetical protein